MDKRAPAKAVSERSQPLTARESIFRDQERTQQLRWILFWISMAIGSAAIAAIAAFAIASLQRPSYGARAEIALYAPELAELPEQYLTTQTLLVRSHTVLEPVSKLLQAPTDELEDNLSVDFPEGGALMRIQYVNRDSKVALRRLVAIVDGYLAVLEQLESRQSIRHDVLVPPFILEDPVQPRPLQAAAIGAAAGLTIIIVALILVSTRETKDRQA